MNQDVGDPLQHAEAADSSGQPQLQSRSDCGVPYPQGGTSRIQGLAMER